MKWSIKEGIVGVMALSLFCLLLVTANTVGSKMNEVYDPFEKAYEIVIENDHDLFLIHETDTVHIMFENAYALLGQDTAYVVNQ